MQATNIYCQFLAVCAQAEKSQFPCWAKYRVEGTYTGLMCIQNARPTGTGTVGSVLGSADIYNVPTLRLDNKEQCRGCPQPLPKPGCSTQSPTLTCLHTCCWSISKENMIKVREQQIGNFGVLQNILSMWFWHVTLHWDCLKKSRISPVLGFMICMVKIGWNEFLGWATQLQYREKWSILDSLLRKWLLAKMGQASKCTPDQIQNHNLSIWSWTPYCFTKVWLPV